MIPNVIRKKIVAGIDGKFDDEYTYEFDKQVFETIKYNKVSNLDHYLQEDPKLRYRSLTHNSEGNTIYHEATFKLDAKHIIVHLFKNITQEEINRLNSKGETLLHMTYEDSQSECHSNVFKIRI